ncbi:hypothetical protein D3C85_910890 [compost metagenome]
MGQRRSQCHPVDRASRRPGNDIDDDPQRHVLAEDLQELQVGIPGRAFRLIGIVPMKTAGYVLGFFAGWGSVVKLRGANEVENFPIDPMLIDRQRNATEQDERQSQLFLFHRPSTPRESLVRGRREPAPAIKASPETGRVKLVPSQRLPAGTSENHWYNIIDAAPR